MYIIFTVWECDDPHCEGHQNIFGVLKTEEDAKEYVKQENTKRLSEQKAETLKRYPSPESIPFSGNCSQLWEQWTTVLHRGLALQYEYIPMLHVT